MGTEKLRGIVIREQVKGESNKQIVLLAKGVGRVVLSARGARNAKSKLLAARSCSAMPILSFMRETAFIPSIRRNCRKVFITSERISINFPRRCI